MDSSIATGFDGYACVTMIPIISLVSDAHGGRVPLETWTILSSLEDLVLCG